MNRRRSRFAPALSVVNEILESRVVLSGATVHAAAEVAGNHARPVPTRTTVTANAGTLGQPITFTVTVRGPASAGAPQGTVNLMDHGSLVQAINLMPTTSTNRRFAVSQGTYTLAPEPGGAAFFFGRYQVNASFVPNGAYMKSNARTTFSVNQPTATTLADGVQIATVAEGSGPAIASGQTATVLYTGYLAKTGQIFDNSASHGGTPISYKLGAGQVIPGFSEGTVGMKVGETRIVAIPPAQGYGSTANGPIPANSTLIFIITLKSIS